MQQSSLDALTWSLHILLLGDKIFSEDPNDRRKTNIWLKLFTSHLFGNISSVPVLSPFSLESRFHRDLPTFAEWRTQAVNQARTIPVVGTVFCDEKSEHWAELPPVVYGFLKVPWHWRPFKASSPWNLPKYQGSLLFSFTKKANFVEKDFDVYVFPSRFCCSGSWYCRQIQYYAG